MKLKPSFFNLRPYWTEQGRFFKAIIGTFSTKMPFLAQKSHFFCRNVCKFQKFAYLCNRNRETLVANIKMLVP